MKKKRVSSALFSSRSRRQKGGDYGRTKVHQTFPSGKSSEFLTLRDVRQGGEGGIRIKKRLTYGCPNIVG